MTKGKKDTSENKNGNHKGISCPTLPSIQFGKKALNSQPHFSECETLQMHQILV